MVLNWDEEKNDQLKKSRNISFERIVIAIENGDVLDVLENPNKDYKNQILIIVRIDEYAYVVPTVIAENEFFMKTIFPSRKCTNKYLATLGMEVKNEN